MPVSGSLSVGANLTNTVTTNTLGSVRDSVVADKSIAINDGSGDYQCSKLASGKLVLTANTPQYLDLTTLTTGTGTVSLNTWKYIYLYNEATNPAYVVTVTAADNGGLNGANIPSPIECPGSSPQILSRLLGAGKAVDTTHKSLKFDPGANAQTIDFVIAGT